MRRWVAAALAAAAIGIGGCVVRTDVVPMAFNAGALDSGGDPFRDPAKRKASIVERIVKIELADAYFGQGDGLGATYSVGDWMLNASHDAGRFLDLVSCAAYGAGPRCAIEATDPASAFVALEAQIHALIAECSGASAQPVCRKDGRPDWLKLERALDEVRFHQAVSRAARAVSEVLSEGLVDPRAVADGSRAAFEHTAAYLHARRWRREPLHPVTGLVVKGGSATGIFSAGAVWAVLHLIHGCMSDTRCARAQDLRIELLSGTSTGAMVAIAVDRFNSARTTAERERSIDDIARWFTCYSLTDLYCVRSAPITRLFTSDADAVKGVLEFDGIKRVLTSCVNEGMRRNRSELILNTVDFRTGVLHALSDQGDLLTPASIVEAGLASALLPLIGKPVVDLPVGRHYDPERPEETEPTFLDGGIRSEIPLMPLVRRGAERVLVVASSASVLSETKRLDTAAKIATRYIDVATGGVTESELAHAKRHAESVRFAEIATCQAHMAAEGGARCSPASGCDPWIICATRAWSDACAGAGGSRPARLTQRARALAPRSSVPTLVDPFWRVQGLFRDETTIPGLSGYDFDPPELRRLFRAGAEEARLHCIDVARLLGVAPETGPIDPVLQAKLIRWCSPTLPPHAEVCGDVPRTEQGLRRCGEETPAYLDACEETSAPGSAP